MGESLSMLLHAAHYKTASLDGSMKALPTDRISEIMI